MLNLAQIKQAYELKLQKLNTRDIATTLKCAPIEITYSINAYNLFKEDQEKKDDFAISQLDTEKLNDEYTNINKEKEDLELEKKRLIDREAFVRLFVKNIIYKYKSKDKSLEERYKKLVAQNTEKNKDIVKENFNLYFDLQKVVKEKLDMQEQFNKYKSLIKFKYIGLFFSGCIFGIWSVIIYKILVYTTV